MLQHEDYLYCFLSRFISANSHKSSCALDLIDSQSVLVQGLKIADVQDPLMEPNVVKIIWLRIF